MAFVAFYERLKAASFETWVSLASMGEILGLTASYAV